MTDGKATKKLRLIEHVPAVCAGALAACAWLSRKLRADKQQKSKLDSIIQQLQAEVQHEKEKRAADRAGRIKAEKELVKVQLALQQLTANAPDDKTAVPRQAIELPVFPFRPIGQIRSCFSQRNGTPRQPQLVSAARCVVRLSPDIPGDCLQGLDQYSHVWLLYVFHENTDLAKCLSNNRGQGIKAKIRVPRLDGGRMGVLATRSPHRPAPIGLSVAQVLGVQGRELILGGADLVHGSPILDIKPYVPFCDSIPQAAAPPWVAVEAQDEPLRVQDVHIDPVVRQELAGCWSRVCRSPLSCLASAQDFQTLVEQVLSRDIRSLHQRLHGTPAEAGDGEAAHLTSSSTGVDQGDAKVQGVYHVVLEGVDVRYDISKQGQVVVQGAEVWQQQEATQQ